MSTDAGIKHDHGKPRVSLVVHGFARALLEVSAVATFGAEKYSAHGWVSVPHGCERYTDVVYRLGGEWMPYAQHIGEWAKHQVREAA